MRSVAFGNGTFVAVGDGGAIQTSTDAVAWAVFERFTTNSFNRIIYANNQFLMLGNAGAILTSPDGTNWTTRTSGVTNRLLAAVYANSQFLVGGASGGVLISSNAVQWTVVNAGLTTDINWITFGNGTFVLPIGTSTSILLSSNGLQWSQSSVPVNNPATSRLSQIAYGNGEFKAHVFEGGLGVNDAGYIRSSPNAINWVAGPRECQVWNFACSYYYFVALRILSFLNGDFFCVADVKDIYDNTFYTAVGSSRVDLQACKLEYSIVSPK